MHGIMAISTHKEPVHHHPYEGELYCSIPAIGAGVTQSRVLGKSTFPVVWSHAFPGGSIQIFLNESVGEQYTLQYQK